jgi:hypothetical protein
MPHITMRDLSVAIAEVRKRINSAERAHRTIKMYEDDPLIEALSDLNHIVNVLSDVIEDEKLNNLTKGEQD